MNLCCQLFSENRYTYNPKGLIISRSEGVLNRLEGYEYDNLDRLTQITSGTIGQTGISKTFSYSGNGNLTNNSMLGTYTYDFQSPGSNVVKAHAVSKIAPGNGNDCDVSYNFFNQPTQITEDDYQLDLFYDVNQQR